MRLSFRTCLLALLSATQWHPAVAAGAQYCQNEKKPEFCVAISSRQNPTTQATDLFLSIAAKPGDESKVRRGRGWLAIGTGDQMSGSLMFVLYGDASGRRVTVSARTAKGHAMPTVLDVPASRMSIDVLNTAVLPGTGTGTGGGYYYSAQIACYACDQWPGLNVSSTEQPWIFAANADQVFYGAPLHAPPDAVLQMHQISGHLAVDMPSTLLKDDEPVPSVDINGPRESFGIWSVDTDTDTDTDDGDGDGDSEEEKKKKKSSLWPTAVQVHGLIMTTCFMGVFAFGTLIIRLPPHAHSFRLHWTAQLTASLLAVGSAAYMLCRARHFGPHKIIGLVVTSMLILQVWFGYRHHAVFVRTRQESHWTTLHLWVGRTALGMGILNVGIGLYYAKASAAALVAWLVVMVAELIGYLYVGLTHWQRLQEEERKKKYAKNKAMQMDMETDTETGIDLQDLDESDSPEEDDEEPPTDGAPLIERASQEGRMVGHIKQS
ncbi:hypothetical protein VTN02DRAFT_5090 [Thermoascus thermophilus]